MSLPLATWQTRLLSSVLVVLSGLLACGGPTIEPATRPAPKPDEVPAIVVADDLPATNDADEVVLEDGDDVTVGSVERLLRSIRSNRTIRLRPGVYDLGSVPQEEHDFVKWEKVYDGKEAVISGVENLTIVAAKSTGDADRPTILARPRYAFVLRFDKVKNVTLKNLVLGHTPEGSCTGGVIGANASENVFIEGSDLYGSGTVGVALDDVTHFQFESSKIRECTYGIATINASTDVTFRDSQFTDNAEFDLIDVKQSPSVSFENCSFSSNRTNKGYGNVFFKIDKTSSVVLSNTSFANNTFDQLTNDKRRLSIIGGTKARAWASQQLNKPDPQYNEIYDLARYQQWIVAATQAGIVFWNTKTGRVDKLHKAYISNQLLVRGRYLWAGTYRNILRFDGLKPKAYLPSQKTRGGKLVVGPKGKLFVGQEKLVQLPNHWWVYNPQTDKFTPDATGTAKQTPTALGGIQMSLPYDVVSRKNGEVWAIDFLNSVVRHQGGKTTVMPRKAAYPGSDPRAFHIDPRGQLWVLDFESGYLRFDDQNKTFLAASPVTEKGTGMAIDVQRGRSWFLHYTKGLHLVKKGKTPRFFDLSRLQFMRTLLLDKDGSVWVAGWNALVHLTPQGATGWHERDFVVKAATLAPKP